VPDLQAIGARVGNASMGFAIVRSGVDGVEQLTLQDSPVPVKRSLSRVILDMASHLFWRT
jgi:hypothetical protein